MSKLNQYFQIYNELKNLNTEKANLSPFFAKATEASHNSTCGRKHVGAAIFYWPKEKKENKFFLNKGDLVSQGWNGYKESSDEKRYGKNLPMPTISCQDEYKLFAQRGIDKDSDDRRKPAYSLTNGGKDRDEDAKECDGGYSDQHGAHG